MELAATFTDQDDTFVAALEVEQVYVGEWSTHVTVPWTCQTEFAGMVVELMRACHEAAPATPEARMAWRRLHVALAIALRPIGAQRNPGRVITERLGALREGGRVQELWQAPLCPRRVRQGARACRDPTAGPAETEEQVTVRVASARAVAMVHAGQPGRARVVLRLLRRRCQASRR